MSALTPLPSCTSPVPVQGETVSRSLLSYFLHSQDNLNLETWNFILDLPYFTNLRPLIAPSFRFIFTFGKTGSQYVAEPGPSLVILPIGAGVLAASPGWLFSHLCTHS